MIPSEEIKIVFGISSKCIHHKCGEGDENRCDHKNFHKTDSTE
ncbi:hypothetical protein SynA1528_01543 [Synechococcus sp. A15-28]|nr:hypothetical protein SynA1528_01543 [Synechococcus sp. A15-28]